MKCAREKCLNKAIHGGRNQNLCYGHYQATRKGNVNPARARKHLTALSQAGYSLRELADLTGLTQRGLLNVQDLPRRIRIRTEDQILSVQIRGQFAGRGRVDAAGTRRRIRALMAAGYPQRLLEERLGMKPRHLSPLLHRQMVYTATARKVRDLYEELQMIPGPSARSRSYGKRMGWAVPLAWDEDSIDDPNGQPDTGVDVPVSAVDRIEELRALGFEDTDEIARRLGLKPNSVKQALRRAA